MKLLPLALLAAAAPLVLAAAGASAARPHPNACRTAGLRAGKLRVVALRADGVSCHAAERAAKRVVRALARGRPLSAPGSESLALSSTSCTGCPTRTHVTIGYRAGSITLTIAGARPGAASSPTLPLPPGPSPGGPVV